MAVKAVGFIRGDQSTFEENGNITVHLDIQIPGTNHTDTICGEYAADADPATVNAALAAFVKSYAAANMGVTFGAGDIAVVATGVQLVQSS